MSNEQKMREALEYVQSYIEECDHWDNKEPLLGDIAKFLADQPAISEIGGSEERQRFLAQSINDFNGTAGDYVHSSLMNKSLSAVSGEPAAWWLHVKRHDAHYFAIDELEKRAFKVLADKDDEVIALYASPQISSKVPEGYRLEPDDGCRLTSYAEDGSTCTLNLNGQEIYFDRNDHVTALAASKPDQPKCAQPT